MLIKAGFEQIPKRMTNYCTAIANAYNLIQFVMVRQLR